MLDRLSLVTLNEECLTDAYVQNIRWRVDYKRWIVDMKGSIVKLSSGECTFDVHIMDSLIVIMALIYLTHTHF